ncbi:hypothetical protein DVH24_027465 [Malus domestica]|uniref:Uncharacterized protein n=1 Tax=Malus domestica TaxID=3750 RepID=A0A498HD27_MALDO|nr:hypothetical protein DVH24_027465 [Malus domestica]
MASFFFLSTFKTGGSAALYHLAPLTSNLHIFFIRLINPNTFTASMFPQNDHAGQDKGKKGSKSCRRSNKFRPINRNLTLSQRRSLILFSWDSFLCKWFPLFF